MKRLLWHWVISTVALILAVAVLQKGVHMNAWYHAVWLAPLLGFVNVIVGGITGSISWFAMPANLLTLGCFGFVLSFILYTVAVFLLGTHIGEAFRVDGFWWAAALAAVMALFSTVLNIILPGKASRRR